MTMVQSLSAVSLSAGKLRPEFAECSVFRDSGYEITVIGHCSVPAEGILPAYRAGTLRDAEGQFAVILEGDGSTVLVQSRFGVQDYFYAEVGGRLVHGPTVLDVLARSGLPWRWDRTALGDMLHLEHGLEEGTLHPEIKHLPAGATLEFRDGRTRADRFDWETAPGERLPARPEVALECFNQSVRSLASENPALLMTGGFDSRTILSALLHAGIKPTLVVAGYDETFDVIVARSIARDFGLELRIAELTAEDFVEHGADCAALTGGILPMGHWSPYIYARKWGVDPSQVAFVGMNGEWARTFYLDRGIVTRVLDAVASGAALRYYWKMKHLYDPGHRLTFRPEEFDALAPEVAAELRPENYAGRVGRCMDVCRGELLRGLDRFYLRERVAHFMGNILRLMAANLRWRAPFLDNGWVDVVGRLPRSWKMGSNWHRYAVARNCPKLMDYPEQYYSERWAPKAPPLYWRRKHKIPYITYAYTNNWLRDGVLRDYVRDHAESIAELVPASLTHKLLDEHGGGTYRGRGLYYLATLMFWKEALGRLGP